MLPLPKEIKLAILDQELNGLRQSEYLLEVRHRVNKKLGATPEELKVISDQLTKITLQIESYESEKELLENEKTA